MCTHTYTITDTKPPLLVIPSPPAVKINLPSNPHGSAGSSVSAGFQERTCRLLVCALSCVVSALFTRERVASRALAKNKPVLLSARDKRCTFQKSVKSCIQFKSRVTSVYFSLLKVRIILLLPMSNLQTNSTPPFCLRNVTDYCSSAHISLSSLGFFLCCPLFPLLLSIFVSAVSSLFHPSHSALCTNLPVVVSPGL